MIDHRVDLTRNRPMQKFIIERTVPGAGTMSAEDLSAV